MMMMIFHKQSKGRRTPVECKSNGSCNQRFSRYARWAVVKVAATRAYWPSRSCSCSQVHYT